MPTARTATVSLWGAVYLALQGTGIAAWWVSLLLDPPSAASYLPAGWPPASLWAFAGADLLFGAVGSWGAAVLLWRRPQHPALPPVLWLVTGALAYGTLWCWGLVVTTGEGWAASLIMTPAVLLTFLCARFRPSESA